MKKPAKKKPARVVWLLEWRDISDASGQWHLTGRGPMTRDEARSKTERTGRMHYRPVRFVEARR